MKKLTFSIVVAVLYVIYIVYDRSHAPVPSLVTAPSAQNILSLQQTASSSSPGSAGLPSATAGATAPNAAPQPTPVPVSTPAPTPAPNVAPQGQYKDGQYTGSSADAFYGFVQVKAIVSGGKITDVQFLSYPNDRQNSVQINSQAMPYLTQEAIAAQSANVNIVSGATDTSQAFIQSLASALAQAKA